MPDIILEDKTINEPVADEIARSAIPTGTLNIGDIVFQVDEKSLYSWDGVKWEKVTTYIPSIGLGKDYDTLKDAIDSGYNIVEQKANTTEYANISLSSNLYILNSDQYSIDMGEYTITMNSNDIYGKSGFLFFIFSYSSAKTLFNGSVGTVSSKQLLIYNQSTSNDAKASDDAGVQFRCDKITYQVTGNFSGQMLAFNRESYVQNLNVLNLFSLTNADDIIHVNDTSLVDQLSIYPDSSQTNNIITIEKAAVINRLLFSNPLGAGPHAVNISLFGKIGSIAKSPSLTDACNVSISLDEDGVVLSNASLEEGVITNNKKTNHVISNVSADSIVDTSATGGSYSVINSSFSKAFTVQTSNNTFMNVDFNGSPTFEGANTKISFCDFASSFSTDALSSGKIIGSNAASSPTLSGTYSRSGNDLTIGNDSDITVVNITSIDTPYSASINTVIRADAIGGVIAVSLPTAVGESGLIITVKKIDVVGNSVKIEADGLETIDGSSTKVITGQNDAVRIMSNGLGWDII